MARTEEGFVWTAKVSGGFTSLAYGPADPMKSPLFLLSCLDGIDIAVLDVRSKLPDTKPGTPLEIELSGGGLTAPLKAEAVHDDADGTVFGEASDFKVKPVVEVLRADGPVTVKVGEVSTELSDQGRAAAVDQFTKDCKLD